jgi:hypothetical protein
MDRMVRLIMVDIKVIVCHYNARNNKKYSQKQAIKVTSSSALFCVLT